MAEITITIPNAALPRITDAFASEFSYQETTPEGEPNPVTKAQFTKTRVIEYIKQVTRNHEANIAAQAARTAKETEINSVNIT